MSQPPANATEPVLLDPQRFSVVPGWRPVVFGLVLLVLALLLDWRVKEWVDPIHLRVKHDKTFFMAIKQPGEYWVPLVVTGLLWALHPWRWRASAVLAMGIVYSALITAVLKWMAGRTRPIVAESDPYTFDWFRGGLPGLFDQKNLSFPSGHATMAFATAACLAMLLPRYRWLWWVLAGLTALERVLEMAHHLSEAVLGAMVGIVGFRLAVWVSLVVTGQKRPAAG